MFSVPSFTIWRHSKRFSVIRVEVGLLLYFASAFISLILSSIVLLFLALVMNSARATSSKFFSGKTRTRSLPFIAVVSSITGPPISFLSLLLFCVIKCVGVTAIIVCARHSNPRKINLYFSFIQFPGHLKTQLSPWTIEMSDPSSKAFIIVFTTPGVA